MLDWNELVTQAIAVRKEEKLSQRDLAALAGVTPPTVIKFEQSSTSLRVDSALAILTALGLAGRASPAQKTVDELAELFSEGVQQIWNRPVTSDRQLDGLVNYDRDWRMRVRKVLRRGFPRAELLLFSRLGVIPKISRNATYDARHAKILREYVVREERLRDMVRRYSGRDIESQRL